MSKTLRFDCFNGVSGDMILGALVDLGLDCGELETRLRGLPVGEFHLKAERVKRQGIMGTKVDVEVQEDPHGHAHLRHVVEKVRAAGLPPLATERAVKAFELLADAEARVHGSTREKIHFHEVGAKDAILDVCGAMVGVEMLGIDSFSASVIAVGVGTVKCQHGIMPVPAPATAEILRGAPTEATDIPFELTTPTGAAILRVLCGDRIGVSAAMTVSDMGYGAGTRVIEGHPNMLRISVGESVGAHDGSGAPGQSAAASATGAGGPFDIETITILETELDDLPGEALGYLMDRLFENGARDAQFQSVQMKKNRPGVQVRVLCAEADVDGLIEILFRETSAFGLRVSRAERRCLRRRMDLVRTSLGEIAVKVGLWGDRPFKVSPEFEDCREIARRTGFPLLEVYEVARRAIEEQIMTNDGPPDHPARLVTG